MSSRQRSGQVNENDEGQIDLTPSATEHGLGRGSRSPPTGEAQIGVKKELRRGSEATSSESKPNLFSEDEVGRVKVPRHNDWGMNARI